MRNNDEHKCLLDELHYSDELKICKEVSWKFVKH